MKNNFPDKTIVSLSAGKIFGSGR